MDFLYLLQNLRETQGGTYDGIFLVLRYLGDSTVTFLLLAWCYWCVDKSVGLTMAINVSVASWFNQWIKKLLRIERPWIRDTRLTPVAEAIDDATGYAMPAGYTQRAFATWGIYGFKAKNIIRSVVCFALIALLMFTGPYLGTNTMSEELAALSIGIFIMELVDKILAWVEDGLYRDILVGAILCILIYISILIYGNLSNAGTAYGIILGWILERRIINFSPVKRKRQALSRFLSGAAFIILIQYSSSVALAYITGLGSEKFVINFVIAFFVMFIHPLVFSKWEEGYRREVVKGSSMAVLVLGLVVLFVKYQDVFNFSKDDCVIIADGGYSSIAPENTKAAFTDAEDIGANAILLNVQETADGQIVVYSDPSIWQNTGVVGAVSWYTLEELEEMDVSKGFDGGDSSINYYDCIDNFGGSKIMTLENTLKLLRYKNIDIYIRILDYFRDEEDPDYVSKVLDIVKSSVTTNQVVYGASKYRYIKAIEAENAANNTLFISASRNVTKLMNKYPADNYGLSIKVISQSKIEALHDAGLKCYVVDADTTALMKRAKDIGADGIITDKVGIAKVMTKADYSYLSDNYIDSICVPAMYDSKISAQYDNYVMQGITKVRDNIVISAYDHTGKGYSILYLMNADGRLMRVINLGFKAHAGGLAYDSERNLLWITAARGQVYAIDWNALVRGDAYRPIYKFDAGLYNNYGNHVASYLAIDSNKLYVGSYCVGQEGILNQYDIDTLLGENDTVPEYRYSVPEKIQGVTFYHNSANGHKILIMTQCDGIKNSRLLSVRMRKGKLDYENVDTSEVIPAMVEQPLMTDEGLYLLFESSASIYRNFYRLPNDQIWLVNFTQ